MLTSAVKCFVGDARAHLPGESMQAEVTPILDEPTRAFVKRTLDAGLLELDDIKKVVASLLTESDQFTPERIATGLVGAGVLTKWQSTKLLAGKNGGFQLGAYRLLRPLGKGGMGVVYLGEHVVMKRLMALKILPPEASRDRRRIELFKSEARACAQLDHQNIVRAYDFAEVGDKLYIVMEYVDGVDMHLRVQRDGVMSVGETVDVLLQATLGLTHAHERGIVHRDIKPSNLLLRTDGVVKLSDLGLARIGFGSESETIRKKLMGTADFVSPEQAIDEKTVDCTADIYSLGCTAFYMLTGRTPFDGTAAQKLAKHQTIPIPNVRELRPDCPQVLADLIERMTAKRPQDRPKSTGELLSQFQRLALLVTHESSPAPRQKIVAAGDTAVDRSFVAGNTLEDAALFDGVEASGLLDDDVFDFANLPISQSSDEMTKQNAGMNHFPVNHSVNSNHSAAKKEKRTFESGSTQAVLLGVGLALAVIALIVVLVAVFYTAMRSDTNVPVRLKATEEGKSIIVVDR